MLTSMAMLSEGNCATGNSNVEETVTTETPPLVALFSSSKDQQRARPADETVQDIEGETRLSCWVPDQLC